MEAGVLLIPVAELDAKGAFTKWLPHNLSVKDLPKFCITLGKYTNPNIL